MSRQLKKVDPYKLIFIVLLIAFIVIWQGFEHGMPLLGSGWQSVDSMIQIDGRVIPAKLYRSKEHSYLICFTNSRNPEYYYMFSGKFKRAGCVPQRAFVLRPDKAILSRDGFEYLDFERVDRPELNLAKMKGLRVMAGGYEFNGFEGELVHVSFP